jgi:uncharacterized protein (DUF1015 family)
MLKLVSQPRSTTSTTQENQSVMAHVFPFRAVTPTPETAVRVSSPPYDVMSTDEARTMALDNPLSFLRVIRSEIDLPVNTNPYSDEVYAKAAENYRTLKQTAPMEQSDTPRFYVYRLEMNGHVQTGIAATPAVADYDNNIIKKHEKTRQAKENDRTRHILTLRAQTGMVFLTYRDTDALDSLVEQTTQTEPLFDFRANDGVKNTLWQVPDNLTNNIIQAFAEVPNLYIADGHHRAASASRTCAELSKATPDAPADAAWTRFLAVIFPASQLQILPYNRVIKGLNGHTSAEIQETIKEVADITPADSPTPTAPGTVCMYLDKKWWKLTLKADRESLPPVDALDVSLLQNLVLAPVFGIADPRTDDRIDFVGGIRGTSELEKRVDTGDADIAFSMYPTTVNQLMAISDADEVMPPKSTWFEPKLRDGLLVHEI